MKYTTYYEEKETLQLDKYIEMKECLLKDNPKYKIENLIVRKLRFITSENYSSQTNDENIPKYYIGICNGDENQIFIERKSTQGTLHYKSHVFITKEECEQILNGELQWMKNHKKSLINDFYLQMTINGMKPGYITEYDRELLSCSKNDYIIFNKKIKRAAGREIDLFSNNLIMISCLSEDRVNVAYKRKFTLPAVFTNILQQQDDTADFVFAV